MAQQKAKDQIEAVLRKLQKGEGTKFSSMTYEQGIEEALLWVLGEIEDDEFEYAP